MPLSRLFLLLHLKYLPIYFITECRETCFQFVIHLPLYKIINVCSCFGKYHDVYLLGILDVSAAKFYAYLRG